MGDRRMAEIKTKDGSLYVYTHWDGDRMPANAKVAILEAKNRWYDHSYATNTIVGCLTARGRDGLGFGLMPQPTEEDSYNAGTPSIVIDLVNRTLTVDGALIPFNEITECAS